MSFRSYIREFSGAISLLFRPSLPWGLAAGSGSNFRLLFEQKEWQEQQQQQQQQQQKETARRKKQLKSSFFYGLQKLHQALFGRTFTAFPSFTAMGICRWEWFDFRLPFEQKEYQEQQQQQQQQETASSAAGEKWLLKSSSIELSVKLVY